jgi:hypothetical protein
MAIHQLYHQFLRLNFYIFTFMTFAAAALALTLSGQWAIIAAKCSFVFAGILLIGCIVNIFLKLFKSPDQVT